MYIYNADNTYLHSSEQCKVMAAMVAFICTMFGWSSNGTNTTKTIRIITMETGMQDGRHHILRFFLLKQII